MLYAELKEKLKIFDEVTLLELFELDSEQLVELCSDYIEENYDKLLKEVEE
jgi:hypothetical protein